MYNLCIKKFAAFQKGISTDMDMQNMILLCEDSVEGILTGVYEAYALHAKHSATHLQATGIDNYCLFTTYQKIAPDPEKSKKVLRTIARRFGPDAYAHLFRAMVSYDQEKADAVYHTIVIGLSNQYNGKLMEHLSNPYIHKVFTLSRNTIGEYDHLRGFLRFQELKGGILLARYKPKNDITAMLMPHFADRLPKENFAIYDEGRHFYAVHPKGQQWYMVRGDLPFHKDEIEYSQEEKEYQALYRHFCQTIAIKERKNQNLQRNMLPLRFREYMPEFYLDN